VGGVDGLQVGDPSQIGPFRLLRRLGEGGMGRVFLGTSPGGRKVAIKVMQSYHANDPEFRRRFAREVAAARQVGGFHTAAVVGADSDADPPWMATAYIPGPSLAEAVAGQGPLNEAEVRNLGAALAEGLAAIHACGLIHRDLKPGNVILGDDGPRIIDFGIAKGADATALTGSSAVIGTLHYMSPEQLHGQELNHQSDVFALGGVLIYAATGHGPFDALTIPAVITRILTDLPDLDPLTGPLRDVIAGCLAKAPGDRPSPSVLLARFSAPEGHNDRAVITPPGAFARAVPPPRPSPVDTSKPVPPGAREPSLDSTIDVGLDARQRHTASPAARAEDAFRLARRLPRRARRRRNAWIAAAAAATASIAVLGFVLSDKHPAGTLSATLTGPGSSDVLSVAFGPDNSLATSDSNGHVYLWNTATNKLTDMLTVPGRAPVDSVAFGPDGTLATSDENGGGHTYLWKTATNKLTATLTDPINYGTSSVAFGPADTLATLDNHGNIYLWNTTTDKLTAALTVPRSAGVRSIAFGPENTLAGGGGNGSTYVWNTTTGKLTAKLTDPASEGVTPVAFGPKDTLAAGDDNGNVYLWNTAADKLTATLTDPTSEPIASVAFGPDSTLAAGGSNGSTYLWNAATDKLTATLTDVTTFSVNSVAFGLGGTCQPL
jgi:serine/threonine protein kinase